MAIETFEQMQARAQKVEKRMYERYGASSTTLKYSTPFELAVAVILSDQCSDEAVNKVTPELFAKYPTPEKLAQADPYDVEPIIHPLGLSKSKTSKIIAMAQKLVSDFGGVLPDAMDALQTLPGIGRKNANCIMDSAFRDPQGIAVDTHVFRIAHRLEFSTALEDTPDKVEQVLLKIYPKDVWGYINHQWIDFGREFCKAKNPLCQTCFIGDLCPTQGMWDTIKFRKENDRDN
ncbi:MAG: endonuclease III [Eggerthellaceae bacterium]|nr:endonuclease III [Eggerthellaceae bacterium]